MGSLPHHDIRLTEAQLAQLAEWAHYGPDAAHIELRLDPESHVLIVGQGDDQAAWDTAGQPVDDEQLAVALAPKPISLWLLAISTRWADIYSEDWQVANERPTPDDAEHRIMRELDLTVAGCNCHRCCGLRDRGTVAMQPFGNEDDRALKAMRRMDERVSTKTRGAAAIDLRATLARQHQLAGEIARIWSEAPDDQALSETRAFELAENAVELGQLVQQSHEWHIRTLGEIRRARQSASEALAILRARDNDEISILIVELETAFVECAAVLGLARG